MLKALPTARHRQSWDPLAGLLVLFPQLCCCSRRVRGAQAFCGTRSPGWAGARHDIYGLRLDIVRQRRLLNFVVNHLNKKQIKLASFPVS